MKKEKPGWKLLININLLGENYDILLSDLEGLPSELSLLKKNDKSYFSYDFC